VLNFHACPYKSLHVSLLVIQNTEQRNHLQDRSLHCVMGREPFDWGGHAARGEDRYTVPQLLQPTTAAHSTW